jgi:PAS domain S-box-containing protein
MFKGIVVKFGLLVACILLVLTGSLLLVTRTGFQEMSESVETITETMLQKDILYKNLRDRGAAESYGSAVTQYFSWVARPHLWNFNDAALKEATEGVLEVPYVIYGAVYDESRKIREESQKPSAPEEETLVFRRGILYQGTFIGSVEIWLHISYIQDLQRENETVKENLIASFRRQTGEIQKNILRNNVITALAIALGASLGLLFLALELQRRAHQAQKQIQESEEKFRRIFHTAPYGMALCSLEKGSILEGNRALEEIFGHSLRELRGETLLHLGIIPDINDFEGTLNLLRQQQPLSNVSQTILHASGEERHLLYSLSSLQAENNLGLLIAADMTEHHHLSQSNTALEKEIQSHTRSLRRLDGMLKKRQVMMEEIQSQLHLLNKSFEHVGEGIFMADQDQQILTVNPAFTAITGYTLHEMENKTLAFFENSLQPQELYEAMYRRLRENHFWEGELWQLRKNGDIYPLLCTFTALTDQEGTILHYIGVLQDRSEIHQSRVELEYETLHDNLTKLPNRLLFLDRLTVACKQAEEQ